MATQYWDEVLYPSFRASIRGTIYGVISQDTLDEECYNVARRAIATFKFPKVSLEYETFYAYWDDGILVPVDPDVSEEAQELIPHAYFVNEVSYNEIEVILAWMKVYWTEMLISNADNFDEIYTDVNIKTYSRANAVDKNNKLMQQFREQAKDIENRYSRVNSAGRPSLGDINE